jgi:hypothetical protein
VRAGWETIDEDVAEIIATRDLERGVRHPTSTA